MHRATRVSPHPSAGRRAVIGVLRTAGNPGHGRAVRRRGRMFMRRQRGRERPVLPPTARGPLVRWRCSAVTTRASPRCASLLLLVSWHLRHPLHRTGRHVPALPASGSARLSRGPAVQANRCQDRSGIEKPPPLRRSYHEGQTDLGTDRRGAGSGQVLQERPSSETPRTCGRDMVLEQERVHMVGSAPQEIDAIIRRSGDWRGETLSRLRGIVLGAGPAVVEEVKWKKPSRPEGVPVWSLDGIVCIGEMLKKAVRLTFPKGAQLKDPKKLFNARLDSSSVRAIDFLEGEKLPEAALRALILEAVGRNV